MGKITRQEFSDDLNNEVDGMQCGLSTHEAVSASTSAKGHVQLTSSLTSTSASLAATASAAKSLKDSLDNLWKTIYPVGSLYETTNANLDPNAHFGGTWERYGSGRVTVSWSPTDTEFDTGGKTGGAKTHTLTEAQMPSHNHANYGYSAPAALTSGGNGHLVDPSVYSAIPTGLKGGGAAHNNLQPYITVFRWRRTA